MLGSSANQIWAQFRADSSGWKTTRIPEGHSDHHAKSVDSELAAITVLDNVDLDGVRPDQDPAVDAIEVTSLSYHAAKASLFNTGEADMDQVARYASTPGGTVKATRDGDEARIQRTLKHPDPHDRGEGIERTDVSFVAREGSRYTTMTVADNFDTHHWQWGPGQPFRATAFVADDASGEVIKYTREFSQDEMERLAET